MLSVIAFASLTGFFGDLGLQFAVLHGYVRGLVPYFKQHGRAEATCIAAGMLTLFTVFYSLFLPYNYVYLGVYGILLDLLFRKFMIFPSLKGYYANISYFWSGFWGAVPLMLPLFLFQFLSNV